MFIKVFLFSVICAIAATKPAIGTNIVNTNEPSQESASHVLCRRMLTSVILNLCPEVDDVDNKQDNAIFGSMVDFNGKEINNINWAPMTYKTKVKSQRTLTLIEEECCDNPCTITQLMALC